MMSYVYFFQHKTKPLVKIGKALCWETRGAEVGRGDIIDVSRSLIKKVDSEQAAYDLEFLLHKLFEASRQPLDTIVDGYTEWFCDSVMENVKLIVRGLEVISGTSIKKKTKKMSWEGESINYKATSKELFALIQKHSVVRVENLSVYMQVKSEGFQFVMVKVIEAILKDKSIQYESANFPAWADFPEREWSITFKDKETVGRFTP